MDRLFNTILVFLIIFGFKIDFTYNSTVLATIIIFLFRFRIVLTNFPKLLKKKYIKKTIYFLIGIIFYSFFVAIYSHTMELNIIQSLINQSFILFSVLIFYASIYDKYTIEECHLFIFNAFALQSIIMLTAYNVTSVADWVRSFQDENTLKVGTLTYSGFRGLALSAAQFFWLSGVYAMVIFILIYKGITSHKNKLLLVNYIILISIGGIFTGRTAFMGLLFGFIYFMLTTNIKQLFKLILSISIIIIVGYFLIPKSFYSSNLFSWAFEFVINYQEKGTFSTKSSETLVNRMFFLPEFKTILIGDGRWIDNKTGGYYMQTDAGYMRTILFYGIGGLIVFYLYAKHVTMYFKKLNLFKLRNHYIFLIFLFVIQLIQNIKGHSLGYMTSTQALLFLYFIPYLCSKKNEQ